MSKWELPTQLPGGDLLPFMSGRHRATMIDALFHHTGGFERAAAWIEKNDDNYGEFLIKIWAKGATRPTAVESLTPTASVEDLLARLDAGEHAKVVS